MMVEEGFRYSNAVVVMIPYHLQRAFQGVVLQMNACNTLLYGRKIL